MGGPEDRRSAGRLPQGGTAQRTLTDSGIHVSWQSHVTGRRQPHSSPTSGAVAPEVHCRRRVLFGRSIVDLPFGGTDTKAGLGVIEVDPVPSSVVSMTRNTRLSPRHLLAFNGHQQHL